MSRADRKKDFDYFDSFITCAQYALDAAIYLRTSLASFDVATIEAQVDKMHHIENEADMQKHEMLKHLSYEFLPPIEREDIVSMSQELDDVVDTVEEVMRRAYMFNIRKIIPAAEEFAELIVRCCQALLTTVQEFKSFKKSKTIHQHIIAVNALENEGDRLYAKSMRELFLTEGDLRHTMVWTTMLDCMENCLDACEDVADIIEGVIMKNT